MPSFCLLAVAATVGAAACTATPLAIGPCNDGRILKQMEFGGTPSSITPCNDGRTLKQMDFGGMASSITLPTAEFAAYNAKPPACSKVMAGCTGNFVTLLHGVNGTVMVLDDCTFRVQGWEFDGQGPKVEWWAAKATRGDPETFPYNANAIKVGELRDVGGSYPVGVHLPPLSAVQVCLYKYYYSSSSGCTCGMPHGTRNGGLLKPLWGKE
jgi:hypothetical protein